MITNQLTSLPNVVVEELVACLQWFIDEDETNDGDVPIPELGNRSWDEINAYWLDGKRRAAAAIASVWAQQGDT